MQDSARSSASTVNIERPIPASVPSRDEGFNLGQEDWNVGCVLHATSVQRSS